MNAFTSAILLWLADFLLLSSVIVAVALVIVAALRQPAYRLAATKSTFVALFLLAALCAAPGWSVLHVLSNVEMQSPRPNESPTAAAPHSAEVNALRAARPTLDPHTTLQSPAPAIPAPAERAMNWSLVDWPRMLVLLYAAGSLVVVAWLGVGSLAARRIVHSASEAPAELVRLVARDLPHNVRLLVSGEIDVAVAIGIRRPVILLPRKLCDARSHLRASRSSLPAPGSRLDTILAHELAHITNHDLHWLAVSRVLVVLLWPQPLLWWLRRWMRLDQEALADAAAAELTSRQSYAEQLIAWARELPARPAPRLSAAVGLWEGPSQLRRRIALLLDERLHLLRECSRGWRWTAAVASVLAVVALSLVTLEPQSLAQSPTPPPIADNAPDENAAQPPAAPVAAAPQQTVVIPQPGTPAPNFTRPVPNTILVRTIDENQQPIAGAEAILFRVNRHDNTRKQIAVKQSNADGWQQFDNVIDVDAEFPGGVLPSLSELGDELLQVVVRKPGRASEASLMIKHQVAKHGEVQSFTLGPAATLTGRITGPNGEPVEGALVSIGATMLDRGADAKAARTAADGRYAIVDAAPFDIEKYREQQAQIQRELQANNAKGADTATLTYFTAPPVLTVTHNNFATKKTAYDSIPGTKDLQLEPPAAIEGRVVFADTKQPAAGALVQAVTSIPTDTAPTTDFIYSYQQVAVRADADGKYRFSSLPAGNYDVWADLPEWVNAGIRELAAPANETTVPAELVLSRGGEVRVRLVDSKTREAIPVTANTRAMIIMNAVGQIRNRPVAQQSIAPNADGRFEVRALPGRNAVIIGGVEENNQYKWAGATMSGGSPTEVNVVENQFVDVDVPILAVSDAQGVTGTIHLAAPVAKADTEPTTKEITGRVLLPDGEPAAGVRVIAFSMVEPGNHLKPYGYQRTTTDDEGHFKLSLHSGGKEVFWILPTEFAQQTHVINDRRGDLGDFLLEEGLHLHGRVVGLDGNPIPDIYVNAELRGGPAFRQIEMAVADNIERSSLTDANGRFDLGPLPPGTYKVFPDERPADDFENTQPRKPLPAAFLPREVGLSAVSELDELEIRPVESVTIEVRFVDSKGNPTRGHGFFLIGEMPDGTRVGFNRQQKNTEAVIFTAPKGLTKVVLDFPLSSMRVRRSPTEPWSRNWSLTLGALVRDVRDIEVVRYQAPTLVVSATDAADNPIPGFKPAIFYHMRDQEHPRESRWIGEFRGDLDFERGADGRWESKFMLPDEEFTLSVTADGYKPYEETISLREAERSEASIRLIKADDAGESQRNASASARTLRVEAAEPADAATTLAANELAGRVVDTEGQPLAGVHVDVWTWYPGKETITDSDGRFKLAGFDERESLEVQFTKPGYGPALFAAQEAGTRDWTITLRNDTYLEGRVLDAEGRPVPFARVRAARGPIVNPQVHIDEVWAETGADGEGRYRLYLEPDKYDLQVRMKSGLARFENTTVVEGDQRTLDIQLRVGPTFRAVVLDAQTNEPVAGIRLWSWQPQHAGIEGTSNADGQIEIANMTPGQFEFQVGGANDRRGIELAGDYARWWSEEAILEHQRKKESDESGFQRNFDDLTFDIGDNPEPVKIFVEKAASIRGRVIDPEGNPVAGATVAPALTGTGNSITGDTRFSVTTLDDGTFHLRLPATGKGKYNLIAHDGKYQQWRRWANGVGPVLHTEPGEEQKDVTLQLSPPCTVRGRVIDADGKPVANQRVRVQPVDMMENRYYFPETRTDTDGNFEFRYVRPGEHELHSDSFQAAGSPIAVQATVRVTASPDRPAEGIELRMPAEIAGRVVPR